MSEPLVARIRGNVVHDVVVALLNDAAEAYPEFICVDVTGVPCGPGWIFDGTGFSPEPPPPPTEQDYIDAVQRHLDDTARSRNYDSILSLCSYGSSKHPKFGHEGKLAVDWRDAVWAYCYQALADVVGGHRPVPTVAEFISELPKMEW